MIPFLRSLRGLVVALLASIACGTPQDLNALFAPFQAADEAHLGAIRAEWATRTTASLEWHFEHQLIIDGSTYQIFSHKFGFDVPTSTDLRHTGAVRLPDSWSPSDPPGSYPVMLWCHGGTTGMVLNRVEEWVDLWPANTFEDFFLIIPAYRGESIRNTPDLDCANPLVWCSDGEPSFLDFDVDDSLMFLDGALEHFPQADRGRVAAFGASRGASVALLASVREPVIRRVGDMFAPTNMLQGYLLDNAALFLEQGCSTSDCFTCLDAAGSNPATAEYQILDFVFCGIADLIRDFDDGVLSFEQARRDLLRRSPLFFAEDFANFEFHHAIGDSTCSFGEAGCCEYYDPSCTDHGDRGVNRMHALLLKSKLDQLGSSAPSSRFFAYEAEEFTGNGHTMNSLVGDGSPGGSAIDRVGSFLYRSRCETTPNSVGDGVLMGIGGSTSIAADDFQLTARRCPPNGWGMFFYGRVESHVPMFSGFRCIGFGACRTAPVAAGAGGTATGNISLTDHPLGDPCTIASYSAGTPWYFQFWYRDGMSTSNFSDFIRIEFQP